MKLILFALFALVVGMVIACAGTSKEEAYPTQEVISPTASKIIPTQDVITLPLIPSPNADEIKAIAGEFEVTDGPNDDGDMFTRPARPADRFASPFENVQAARASNNGALPPDLSLITKARKGGGDYIYALLSGYAEEPPADFELADGMYYNKVFPGHQIAMNPPLGDDAVEYTDGTKATTAQMAKDVTTFLVWAAEPEMEERKRLGIKVMLFLIVLTGLLYALKRKIWSDLH